jgi:hypothetical protein
MGQHTTRPAAVDYANVCFSAIVIAFLAACGNPSLPTSAIPTINNQSRTIIQPSRVSTWMNGDAVAADLLYLTESAGGTVYVYSYPGGKLEGQLTGLEGPVGDCVDASGNVWIPDASRSMILEYAHGGTSPIRVMSLDRTVPNNCSIDPTTGNLAVATLTNVVVFTRARGQPTAYSDPTISEVYDGGYDNKGNFFVDGLTAEGYFQLAELPKGSASFTNLALSTIGAPGYVAWDGKYVAVGDIISNKIYQVQVTGSDATIVGSSLLGDANAPWYVFGFPSVNEGKWNKQDNSIIADDDGTGVGIWTYPAGGNPLKIIGGDSFTTGIVVSAAKKRSRS